MTELEQILFTSYTQATRMLYTAAVRFALADKEHEKGQLKNSDLKDIAMDLQQAARAFTDLERFYNRIADRKFEKDQS